MIMYLRIEIVMGVTEGGWWWSLISVIDVDCMIIDIIMGTHGIL